MVNRVRAPGAPGFALAEVIVAIVVLAVGVMGAVATATLAVRTLRTAADREMAVRLAAAVLDSLLQVSSPTGNEREIGRHRVLWAVRSEGRVRRISIDVECLDAPTSCAIHFEALHGPPLPPIGGER